MEENNQNNLLEKEVETSVLSPAPGQSIKNDFSAKKWGWTGIVIALLNPVFAGLILGALFLTEPKLRRFGAAVTAISLIWGAISYFLLQKYWVVSFYGF